MDNQAPALAGHLRALEPVRFDTGSAEELPGKVAVQPARGLPDQGLRGPGRWSALLCPSARAWTVTKSGIRPPVWTTRAFSAPSGS